VAKGQLAGVIQQLSRLIGGGGCASLADSQLLARFVDQRDQEAFAGLLYRHGPLVLGVCRQLLRDSHDAEDAFQATFLVLARKAGKVRHGESLAGWLYRVAYRIALNARASAAQRKQQESQVGEMATASPVPDEAAWQELRPVLHEEVSRLPAKYRLPVVLCYLQSKTNEEAALELGCPVGTLKGRLNRARDLLRTRLARRGLALAAALFVSEGPRALATATVPASLTDRTVQAALIFATPHTAAAAASSPAAARLAEGVLKAMFATKLKIAALVVLTAGLLTTGGGAVLYQVLFAQGISAADHTTSAAVPVASDRRSQPSADDKPPRPGFDLADDPLPPGALARLGTLRWRQENPFVFAAFLPGGAQVVTAGEAGGFRVWDAETGKELRRFGTDRPLTDSQRALAPDGRLLAEVTTDALVHLWDVQAGKEVRSIKVAVPAGSSPAVVFAGDSKTLFVGSIFDAVIRQFDVSSGKELRQFTLQRPASSVYRLAVAADGKRLLMSGAKAEGNVASAPYWTLLDLPSGKESAPVRAGADQYRGGLFSGDSKSLILFRNTGGLGIFDVASGEKIQEIDAEGNAIQYPRLVSSADGKLLATFGYDDPVVRLWDTKSGKQIRTVARMTEFWCRNTNGFILALSPDSQTLLAGGGSKALRVYNVTTGKERQEVGHNGGVSSLIVSGDGSTVTSWGADNTVRQWSAATGRERHCLQLPAETQGGLFYPDGKRLLYIGDRSIHLQDVAANEEVRRFQPPGNPPPAPNRISAKIAVSADGKSLAIVSGINACLYDLATGKEVRRFEITTPPADAYHGYSPGQIGLSPDGSLAAVSSVYYVRATAVVEHVHTGAFSLWHAGSGKLIRQSKSIFVTAFAFAPDGLTLATAFDDKTLAIQEIASGQVRLRLPGKTGVSDLAFSADGRTLIAGTADHTVVAWDAFTGKELAVFRGHRAAVNAVAVSADGRRIFSGSDDTTVLGWDTAAFNSAGRPQPGKLSEAAAEARFRELAEDNAEKAHQAIVALTQDPGQAVATLRKLVAPAKGPTPQRLAELLADLASDTFAVREKASGELQKLGELAEPILHEELKKNPSLEKRQRMEQVLDKLRLGQPLPAEVLQTVRAIEVLGQIATPKARQVLQTLGDGAPGARATREAKAALTRLRQP